MEFRIADTVTDSLTRLTGNEEKAVKTTVFDLQLNPASPGLSFQHWSAATQLALPQCPQDDARASDVPPP